MSKQGRREKDKEGREKARVDEKGREKVRVCAAGKGMAAGRQAGAEE